MDDRQAGKVDAGFRGISLISPQPLPRVTFSEIDARVLEKDESAEFCLKCGGRLAAA